jgi:hypothetical protein
MISCSDTQQFKDIGSVVECVAAATASADAA